MANKNRLKPHASLADRIARATIGYDLSTPIVNGSHCLLTNLAVSKGYPKIRGRGGRVQTVVRAVWELSTGTKITSDEHVLHECDNPGCIEFRHLFLGDQTLNDADRDAKQRQSWGVRNGMAKLTAIEVRAIRADPRSNSEIGLTYGITGNSVRRIKRRERWGLLL
jgi:hypothetical protein